MTDVTTWQLITVALGSGVTVKIADIAYQEIKSLFVRSQAQQQFVERHLDPLLKATDELVAKLRSLSEKDFRSIYDIPPDSNCLKNHDLGSLTYLFGIFWARIERIRRDGMSVQMAKNKRGRQLQAFFDCIESGQVRIVDRIQQRAIGECLLNGTETRTFTDFVASFEGSSVTRRWMAPLLQILTRAKHEEERQQLNQYATVLHAMIDTLDPSHHITSSRPSISKKLTRKTWTHLRYRVFKVYLKFVIDVPKYIGPPKRRPERKRGGNV
ncbi:MAG: hypothetical protein J0I24_01605 [Thiomonas arsenitoxydans]|uniref:Uncharacterized protein n=1 Tax=Thiomonas arsenitoxydans (strain DSM 22701 / CIP 110005 / 3As) TaxID=426114 RepID=A0A8I1MT59_THIA3|nr:hypothetical protein [Thiomonas arsenitoxydans]MBN8742983.1 hypothetical protein [Thiomonas arsenitoxydans]